MYFRDTVWITIIVLLLHSCAPTQQELATEHLESSNRYLLKSDTLNAILCLDSIVTTLPEAEEERAVAIKSRKALYRDIVLKLKVELLESDSVVLSLKDKFVEERGEFDRHTQLVPKRQQDKNSWDRSFIEVHLNEIGDLYLSSNYLGEQWLDHTGLRVYDHGDDAKTDTVAIGNVNNHHSDFMEMCWERIQYKDGKADAVMEFIAKNRERRLKAVFLGNRYFYIILETYDKEAVYNALAMSKALKSKIKLEKELELNRSRMNLYN